MSKVKTKIETTINDEFQCEVLEIQYGVREKVGIAILHDGHCPSMCGAIRVFQRIDPDVRQIRTPGSPRGTSVYTRVGDADWHPGIIGEWKAGRVHPASE